MNLSPELISSPRCSRSPEPIIPPTLSHHRYDINNCHSNYSDIYYGVEKNTNFAVVIKKYVHRHVEIWNPLRELAFSSILNHECFISVYDYYFNCGTIELVFLRYKCLVAILPLTTPFDSAFRQKKYDIANQAIDAVQYLHSKNIVHSDLAFSNCYVDENYNFLIGDFGNTFVGEQDYILTTTICRPPEGFSEDSGYNEHTDKSTDIWSLGVLLFGIISYDEFAQTIFESIINSPDMESLYTIIKSLPSRINAISEKKWRPILADMLQIEPTKRKLPDCSKYFAQKVLENVSSQELALLNLDMSIHPLIAKLNAINLMRTNTILPPLNRKDCRTATFSLLTYFYDMIIRMEYDCCDVRNIIYFDNNDDEFNHERFGKDVILLLEFYKLKFEPFESYTISVETKNDKTL